MKEGKTIKKHYRTWFLALGLAPLWLAGCGIPAPQAGPHVNSSKSKKTTKPATKTTTTKTTSSKKTKPLKVIAFYDQSKSTVATKASTDPFTFAKAHPGLVTYLSPVWYSVSPTGSLIKKPVGNTVMRATKDHLPLMPLFQNAGGTDAFLKTAALRTTAIDAIVGAAKAQHVPGVEIAFQSLKSSDRTDLTEFMTQLRTMLPSTMAISLSVVPLTSGHGQSSAYNFKALDSEVSAMVLMAYDLHKNGTPAGPVSPYPWVQKSIKTVLSAGVKPSKLYLGIADYGYRWTTTSSTKAVTIPLKAMHQHKYGAYKWDSTYKEAYDKYTSGVIWFVSDRAAKDRIDLAKKDHLGGVAFWRIGYEDATWWNTVASAIGSSTTAPSGSTKANTARSPVTPQYAKKTGTKAKKTLIAPAKKAGKTIKKAGTSVKSDAKKAGTSIKNDLKKDVKSVQKKVAPNSKK